MTEADAAVRPGSLEAPVQGGPLVGWGGVLLIIGFWTLYGVVTTAGLFFSPVSQSAAVPVVVTAVIFLGAYTWAALTLPLFWLTRAVNLESGNRTSRIIALFLLGIVIAAVVSVSVGYISWFVLRRLSGLTLPAEGGWIIARFRFLSDLLACFLILAAGMARDYFLRFQDRQREASDLRAQLVESRLQFLRAQLNPHFLSNTMNAVSALVSKNPKGVRRMIERLSELLRYTLEAPSEPEVSVEQELTVLKMYLEVMEIRYEGRLQTSIEAEPDTMDALVPNLILQPLAENAMEHGLSQAAGYGTITIRAHREGDVLVLAVEDTGPGENGSAEDTEVDAAGGRGGYGLRHTRDRLDQLYGDGGSLALTPTAAGGMTAEVRLPFHTRNDPASAGSRPREGASA